MEKYLFAAIAALLLAVSAAPAQAQDRTPLVNARERNQRARIRQGVASGELTPREAARMRGREAGLTAEKRAMKADGPLNPQERQQLRQTENRDSRAIYRQKHDAQVR